MKTSPGFMFPLLLLAVGGCGPEEARGRWHTRGQWSASDETTKVSGDIEAIGRNDDVLFVLMADRRWDSKITSSLSGDGLKGKGELPDDKGRPKTFTFDSPRAGSGQMTIDGQAFDLSKGRLILIRGGPGEAAIRQLDADLKGLLMPDTGPGQSKGYTVKLNRVEDFAATHGELREFFKLGAAKAAP